MGKPALLQKTKPPRALQRIAMRRLAELLAMSILQRLHPLPRLVVDVLVDQSCRYPFLSELGSDANRADAFPAPTAHEALRESLVAQVTAPPEPIQSLGQKWIRKPLAYQLPVELPEAVLPRRQQPQSGLLDSFRSAQASAPSGASSSAVAATAPATARSLSSIWRAISGCSLR